MGIPSFQALLPSLLGSLTAQTWTQLGPEHAAPTGQTSKESVLEKSLMFPKTHPDQFLKQFLPPQGIL